MPQVKFYSATLRQIHKQFSPRLDQDETAQLLKIRPKTLEKYLSFVTYQNEPLTFEILRAMSFSEANAKLGNRYDKILTREVNLSTYKIDYIYTQIQASSGLESAASRLRSTPEKLNLFLLEFLIDFDSIKKLNLLEFKQLIEKNSTFRIAKFPSKMQEKYSSIKTRKLTGKRSNNFSLERPAKIQALDIVYPLEEIKPLSEADVESWIDALAANPYGLFQPKSKTTLKPTPLEPCKVPPSI